MFVALLLQKSFAACEETQERSHLLLVKKAFGVEEFGQDLGEGRDACLRSDELLWT